MKGHTNNPFSTAYISLQTVFTSTYNLFYIPAAACDYYSYYYITTTSIMSSPSTIDLELHTRWFLHTPPDFPFPSLRAHGDLNADYSWEYTESLARPGSADWVFIGAVQWLADMSITKLRVTWNSADVAGTVRGEQKRILGAGAERLGEAELRLASAWYGNHVVDWCRARIGTTVGDGECWALADQALEGAGVKAVREGHEPPMRSVGKVHGQCVLLWSKESGVPAEGILEMAGVAAGDILQMENGHFQTVKLNPAFNLRSERNVRLVDHTAVIEKVEGEKMHVIEQNTQMEKTVGESDFDLRDMVEGTVRVFRPIGQSYCPQIRGICREW